MKTVALLCLLLFVTPIYAAPYLVKVKAKNKYERTWISELGLSIERVEKDHVIAIGQEEDLDYLEHHGKLIHAEPLAGSKILDFPNEDEKFHNYQELIQAMEALEDKYPGLVSLESIGQSHESRDLIVIKIGESKEPKPATLFIGGHHAREHLSTEIPLMLAQRLAKEFQDSNSRVHQLLSERTIYIIPMANPDGVEFDIEDGRYRLWRKNRSQNSGSSRGVDLNRNYDYKWGGRGSSSNPRSSTYRGPSAFSEPETQSLKDFIEAHDNINVLLSFHSFSKLILYPWGHKYQGISNEKDLKVHQTMARKMSKWNRYEPMQSSDLYLVSGDTTDWSYGVHRIISFTFELDPRSMSEGGFYPGQGIIDRVFEKNWEPCLYLIDHSDNPYRSVEPVHKQYGLDSPLVVQNQPFELTRLANLSWL